MKNINEQLIHYVLENQDEAKNLFNKENHLKYYYKNIALNPLVLSKNQYNIIKNATETIGKLLEKTIKIYYQNKKIEDFFQFNAKQKKILKNYRPELHSIYLSRFDGTFNSSGEFKFIEFNINHPGGTERLDSLTEIIRKFINKSVSVVNKNNILSSYLNTVKKLYQFAGSKDIMGIAYGSTFDMHDMKALIKIASEIKKELKIKVIIDNFVKFTQKGDGLYHKKDKISLLYRAELMQRFWQYDYQAVKSILDCLDKKQIILYNLPNAYLGGTKNLFALWHEKWFWKFLDETEIESIKKYIPQTYGLDSKEISKKEILSKKDNWVIKPIAGFGGSRVYIGKELTDKKWQKIVNIHFGSKHYILQEFIKTELMPILSLNTQNKEINKLDGYLNISPWLIDGCLAGISVRYAPSLIINVKKGGGIMPTLIKK